MSSDYWMLEGTHKCTVKECRRGQHDNAVRHTFIHFTLEDEEHRVCNMRFLVTRKAIRAIRSFANACGLKGAQLKAPKGKDFVGKTVEVDVSVSDGGYPVVGRWRRSQSDGSDGNIDEGDEAALF